VAEARANVLDITHDRTFSRARLGETAVELTLETSGREQIEAIKRRLTRRLRRRRSGAEVIRGRVRGG